MSSFGPAVRFARFVNGEIELFTEHTGRLEYIAISHTWGNVEWQWVRGVPFQIRVSPKKARFIEARLPALVGDTPFWMDIIAVDQRDQGKVMDAVQFIPEIFRGARRTIAIRDGDGLYPCCGDATEGATTWEEIVQKLQGHSDQHYNHAYTESYLQRLWTLQECQLSNSIQFVRVHQDVEQRPRGNQAHTRILNPYEYYLSFQRVTDALFVLAHSFNYQFSAMQDFIRTYISEGTVQRPAISPRTPTDDIFADKFLVMNIASLRTASMPRDYIFATMPQFPWYHYRSELKSLSFNDLFNDFVKQSARAGHHFAYRLTRSMTNPAACSNVAEAWFPSSQQPEPTSLGDFLKLLGQKSLSNTSSTEAVHLCSIVGVQTPHATLDFDRTMDIVRSAMNFSIRIWGESHRGGDLSRLGCWPDDVWNGDRRLQEAIDLWKNPDNPRPPEEKAAEVARLEQEQENNRLRQLGIPWLKDQALRILDLLFCAVDPVHVNRPIREDWNFWKHDLARTWSLPLQKMVVLYAAMVSCQIGLSALEWADELFAPVLIKFKTITVLGLLSKHACPDGVIPKEKATMICAGRHPAELPFGKDLVLVDIMSKMPLGLVPDFLPLIRTDDEFVSRTEELYHTISPAVSPRGALFAMIPMDAISVRGS
ncbi:hypothetical protein OQA88_7213 [Cercophora sp. LCS_1]